MKWLWISLFNIALAVPVTATDRNNVPVPPFGAYTGLAGYWDYQTEGTPCQYIRANRVTGMLQAVFTTSSDSSNPHATKRTRYAHSSGGFLWNDCNGITLPAWRTSWPSLDIMQGASESRPVIVNADSGLNLFIGDPEGSCHFTPVISDTAAFLTPDVACGNGFLLLAAINAPTLNIAYTISRDSGITWTPRALVPGGAATFFTAQASDSNSVGIVLTRPDNSVDLYQSTDAGHTWSLSQIMPSSIVVGADTFQTYLGADMVYRGAFPAVAAAIHRKTRTPGFDDNAGIGFWSPTTGFVLAVPHNAVPRALARLNKPQHKHGTVGYPSIGLSNGTLVIAFQAFMPETSAAGFNYSRVFTSYSGTGGGTWSSPVLYTWGENDARYPSISKWNSAGQPFIVWQDDTEPGSQIMDGAPRSLARQAFFTFIDLSVRESGSPHGFQLEQNYPNPFNPSTTIRFSVGRYGHMSLRVYDLLGRKVATLVDEVMQPGSYESAFNAEGLASGVYLYQLRSGAFVKTLKLILLK